jgi:hypothetical protein
MGQCTMNINLGVQWLKLILTVACASANQKSGVYPWKIDSTSGLL